MRLDVVIPTYNRCGLLPRVLASLLAAEAPAGLDVGVTVVDNNSKDGTRAVVEEWQGRFGGRLAYVFEEKQGRSHALNAGIQSTAGDVVGMVDDDEEIAADWYARIKAAFDAGGVDFIAGPYMNRWGAELPAWFPKKFEGMADDVFASADAPPLVFGKDYCKSFLGGNVVIRRAMFERVGLYLTSLGRQGERLLAGEDDDMYERLLAAGARGLYLPGLIVYHHMADERLTKRYFRKASFWHGVSRGVIDRERRAPVVYLLGVPRWLYGQAARGLVRVAKGALGLQPDPAQRFSDELDVWDFAGFFYGKHFHRAPR